MPVGPAVCRGKRALVVENFRGVGPTGYGSYSGSSVKVVTSNKLLNVEAALKLNSMC